MPAPSRASSAAPSPAAATPAWRRRARHPTTLLALLLVGLLHLGAWWAWNRPVALPDFRGPVGGLAFSPFGRGQSAEEGRPGPTAEAIEADLRRVAPLTRGVRTYTVAGGFDRIPAVAAGLGLRVTPGAWLDRHGERNAAELRRLIAVARAARNVDRVMVGNEVVLRGDLSVPQLIGAIEAVRRAVRQPVSTAEPWHVWLAHPELAAAVDVITIHLLPYWEGVPVEAAVDYAMARYDAVAARFPGKPIVIGEIGWPSDGRDIGAARAGRVNQAAFLRAFFNLAEARGLEYFVMEAFDQPWKSAFEGRAAGYWGMADLDRAAKWPLVGPVRERPDWVLWAAGATAVALLAAGGLLARRPDLRLGGKLLVAGLAQGSVTGIGLVLLAMSETYLSDAAAAVWTALVVGQVLLLGVLLADGFELAETLWGRTWRRRFAAVAAPAGAALPFVSLHLPICNEPPELVRATLDALAALDYPAFEVLVVDNNTGDPALWEPVAEHCARLGGRFRFLHLGRWPGFKAGALNVALAQTAADATVIGVLDSDYVVSPDWLRRMVPFFGRAEVGFTQSPQDYRDRGASAFKRLMYWEYAGFFRCGMVTRNERNAIIQHGTMTLIRRSALEEVGGWAEWCVCEDSELGLRLFRRGWEAVYVPETLGRGVMPDDFAAYRKQRHRWACGAVQIMKRHAGALFNPLSRELTAGQRWHFVTGWAPWLGDAVGLLFVVMGLVWSAGLILLPLCAALGFGSLGHLLGVLGLSEEFPIGLFMLPSIGLFGFKLAQVGLLYAARVPCGWADRVGAAVAGLALTHTVGKAVLHGLCTRRAPFLRTPKLAEAPGLLGGLAMAREEFFLLVLLWAAAAGVTAVYRGGTWEALLWTVVLLVQSVPYLAAVGVSVLAAVPAGRPVRVAGGAPVRGTSAAGHAVARTGEGL